VSGGIRVHGPLIPVIGLVAFVPSWAVPPAKVPLTADQQQAQTVLDTTKEAADAVSQIKGASTGDLAKKKIADAEKLAGQYDAKKKSQTDEEKKWCREVFEPKYVDAQAELERAKDKLVTTDEKLYGLIGNATTFRRQKEANLKRAEMNARNLVQASKAYKLSTEEWPDKLLELAVPSNGGAPFVDGGEAAVKDPWGRPYKLTLEKDAAGDDRPVVSTVSPYGDGKTEIRWPKKEK
jgi:hypothetical protein